MNQSSRKESSIKAPVSRRILLGFLSIIGILLILHLLFQFLNLNVFHEQNGQIFEMSNRLDFDDESSLPTWVSQFLLLAGGTAAIFAGWLDKRRGAKRTWYLIGAIGILFSIDEVGAMHEFALQTIHLAVFQLSPASFLANAWFIILPFVAVIAMLIALQLKKYVPVSVLRMLVLGGGIFVAGAVFIDVITNASGANNFFEKGILVALEESCELLGTTIVFFAISRHIEITNGQQIKQALKVLKK